MMRKLLILVIFNIDLLSGCKSKPVPGPVVPVRHYADCGINLLDCRVGGTIKGGRVAKENALPWLVYVYSIDENEGKICGGSLITPRYVMTAAHCVAHRTVNDTAVVLGENFVDVELNLQTTNFAYLAHIDIYPRYNRGVKEDLKNTPDVALLQLEITVEFGPTMNAICLPTSPYRLYEDELMVVAGWGGTENNEISSKKLMETNVKVYPNKKCKTWGGYKYYKFLKRYWITFKD